MTPDEIHEASVRAEQWLDQLDPASLEWTIDEPLRRVVLARHDVAVAERALQSAVTTAKDEGHTWAEVGATLGVSRQAAHERFGANR